MEINCSKRTIHKDYKLIRNKHTIKHQPLISSLMSDELSSDATYFQRNKIITWARPAASALFAAALSRSKQRLLGNAPSLSIRSSFTDIFSASQHKDMYRGIREYSGKDYKSMNYIQCDDRKHLKGFLLSSQFN